MAVVTRRLERGPKTQMLRKDQGRTALRARLNWALGTAGMALASLAAIHAMHRFGAEWVGSWDLIGSLIGYSA